MTLVGQMAKFVIQGSSIIILARLIAPDEFGLFVMVASISGLAALIGDFGLSAASIQAKRITQQEKSNLFWINTCLGIVAGLVFFCASPLIAKYYNESQILDLARVMCIVFLLSGLTVQHKAELSRNLRFKQLTFTEVVSQLVGLVVALSLAIYGAGVWALVWQQVAAALTVTLMSWFFAKWFPALPSYQTSVRSYLYFGANTMGGAVFNYASSNADKIMLGRYAGAESVGIYGRMFQVFALPLQQLATPLTRVALPILSAVQDDQKRYLHFMRSALTCFAYVFLAGFTLIIVTAPYLVPVVLGESWRSGAPVLQILAIGGIFQGIGYVYYWGFLSRAKTDVMFRLSLISRSLMVFIIVVAAPYGMYAVAAAVSLGLAGNWLIDTVWGLPAMGIQRKSLLSRVWRPVLVFLPFCAAGYAADQLGLFNSFGAIVTIGIATLAELVYVALIALIFPAVRNDIYSLLGLVRKAVDRRN